MFIGRDQLIADLIALVGGRLGVSVIVYGQKRAGKSSVLLHLQQKLTRRYLTVRFSIVELTGTSTFIADLLYVIGSQICRTLRSLAEDEGLSASPPPEPDIEQIRLAPLLKFNDYMEGLRRWMKNAPGFSGSLSCC